MAIFDNKTTKHKRVYLRRKSLLLQKYVTGGVFVSLLALFFMTYTPNL